MANPAWPTGVPTAPERPSFQPLKIALDPITTDFEGGNQRNRARAGDNVGTIGQTIWMTSDQWTTLQNWGKDTIGKWTGRFVVPVWLGSGFVTKVCQFQKGAAPTAAPVSRSKLAVTMALRVFDV